MIKPSIITWVLAIFGAITFLPLMLAQLIMILNPESQKAKDLLIGRGENWRDNTHKKYSLAFAWADWFVILPLFISGNIGVFTGQIWGYVAWLALGIVSIYFSVIYWILEKEYTYPLCGWLAYYTYFWGFFLYWGMGAVVYSIIQIV